MKKMLFGLVLGGTVLCGSGCAGKTAEKSGMLADFISEICEYHMSVPDPENLKGYPRLRWESTGNYQIVYSSKKYVSIKAVEWAYTGGAHGNTQTFAATFENGKRLRLTDLYRSSQEKKQLETLWQQAITRHFKAKSFAEHVKKCGGVFTPFMTENFYLDDKGIHFVYDPYDIDCFAAGTIDIFVPWKMSR